MKFKMNLADMYHKRKLKNQYRDLYINEGVLKDAITFELADENESSFFTPIHFLKMFLQSCRSALIYYFLIIPYLCLYLAVFGAYGLIMFSYKFLMRSVSNFNIKTSSNENESESSLIYNP